VQDVVSSKITVCSCRLDKLWIGGVVLEPFSGDEKFGQCRRVADEVVYKHCGSYIRIFMEKFSGRGKFWRSSFSDTMVSLDGGKPHRKVHIPIEVLQ